MNEILFSILRVTSLVAIVYVGFGFLIYFSQPKHVYYPDRLISCTPDQYSMEFENLKLSTDDDETITGWFIPLKSDSKTGDAVLICHGNGGDIGDRVGTVFKFHSLGYDVMIFDYRGYGKSTGKPSEKGTYKDAMAAWKYLTEEKKYLPENIIIFGRSLGGGIASELAEKVKPKGLVVESSFTSAPDMAAKMFPIYPANLMCSFKYDTRSRMKNISCPVIVAHSKEDNIIPYEHGQNIFKAANEPKLFIEIKGRHNAGGFDIDAEYQKQFKEFMSK